MFSLDQGVSDSSGNRMFGTREPCKNLGRPPPSLDPPTETTSYGFRWNRSRALWSVNIPDLQGLAPCCSLSLQCMSFASSGCWLLLLLKCHFFRKAFSLALSKTDFSTNLQPTKFCHFFLVIDDNRLLFIHLLTCVLYMSSTKR